MDEKPQTGKNPLKEPVKHLIKKYYTSDDIHLNPNTSTILSEIKSDPNFEGLTAADVISFKNSLYEISVRLNQKKKQSQIYGYQGPHTDERTDGRAACRVWYTRLERAHHDAYHLVFFSSFFSQRAREYRNFLKGHRYTTRQYISFGPGEKKEYTYN